MFKHRKQKELARRLAMAELRRYRFNIRADRMSNKIVGGGRRAAKANRNAESMDSQIERLRAQVEADPIALEAYRQMCEKTPDLNYEPRR